jgi:hypothetical protein
MALERSKNGRVVSKRSVINHEESSSWINIVRRSFSDKTKQQCEESVCEALPCSQEKENEN